MRKIIKLTGPQQREYAKAQIDLAPEDYSVQIGETTRTIAQNSLLWPLLADVQRHVDMAEFTQDQIKLRFLDALGTELIYLPKLEGAGMFPCGMRSSTLSKKQFSGLIELIYKWGADHGVKFKEPEYNY
jgi:NinB protein